MTLRMTKGSPSEDREDSYSLGLLCSMKSRLAKQMVEDPKMKDCWGKVTTTHLRNPISKEQNCKGFWRFRAFVVCKIRPENSEKQVFRQTCLFVFCCCWKHCNHLLQTSFLLLGERRNYRRAACWVQKELSFSLPPKGTTSWFDDSKVCCMTAPRTMEGKQRRKNNEK